MTENRKKWPLESVYGFSLNYQNNLLQLKLTTVGKLSYTPKEVKKINDMRYTDEIILMVRIL